MVFWSHTSRGFSMVQPKGLHLMQHWFATCWDDRRKIRWIQTIKLLNRGNAPKKTNLWVVKQQMIQTMHRIYQPPTIQWVIILFEENISNLPYIVLFDQPQMGPIQLSLWNIKRLPNIEKQPNYASKKTQNPTSPEKGPSLKGNFIEAFLFQQSTFRGISIINTACLIGILQFVAMIMLI